MSEYGSLGGPGRIDVELRVSEPVLRLLSGPSTGFAARDDSDWFLFCDTAILAVSFVRSTTENARATNQIASVLTAPGTTRSKSFRLSNSLFSTVSESPTGARDPGKRALAATAFSGVLRSRQARENTESKTQLEPRHTAEARSFGPPSPRACYQNDNAILSSSPQIDNSTLVPAALVRGFRVRGSLLAGNLTAAGCTLQSFGPGLEAK